MLSDFVSSSAQKRISLALSAMLLGTVFSYGGEVSAAGTPKQSAQSLLKADVTINGVRQSFDQPAIVKNGATLVPLKAIFQELGATVKWDQPTQTAVATKESKTIKITVGSSTAYIDGKALKLSANAESINGRVLVPLRFVSEALGADVKWDAVTSTVRIKSSIGSIVEVVGPPAISPTGISNGAEVSETATGTKVGSINVRYGRHTYASKNQVEYDFVMKTVDKAVASFSKDQFGGQYSAQFLRYLDGDIYTNYTRGSDDFSGLVAAKNSLEELVEEGVSKDTIIKASIAGRIATLLVAEAETMQNNQGSVKSAYDVLKHGMSDCDAVAHTVSAVFDALGFNTAIMAGKNHANVMIKIDGNWWEYVSGSFNKVDMSFAFGKGFYMLTQPTTGPPINKADYE